MQTIWGLDLGVASVGFAVLRWDGWQSRDGQGEILALGVRAFPETRDEKSLEPLNAERRRKRLMRRQVRRRRWRRVHLRALLAEAGLLPDKDAQPPAGQDPYALRARGLNSAPVARRGRLGDLPPAQAPRLPRQPQGRAARGRGADGGEGAETRAEGEGRRHRTRSRRIGGR
ncbi:MAG: hypothetical protein RML45_05185 [Acetobacteraceae bacterium]|nr:hypothetical protein [Acetobacteraceae bacterium]